MTYRFQHYELLVNFIPVSAMPRTRWLSSCARTSIEIVHSILPSRATKCRWAANAHRNVYPQRCREPRQPCRGSERWVYCSYCPLSTPDALLFTVCHHLPLPVHLTSMVSEPSPLIAPTITLPPVVLLTGLDSPVSIAS